MRAACCSKAIKLWLFGLRCRAKNKYRSFEASSVGAALCCEEAGTSNRQALSVPASSQHKAAPTELH
ncbi:hypothetical protein EFK07_17175 [Pseudomonas putida]|uniref:Uncharacterized protein n=1 Tax=Pseudomonas putida TaxID=303 RepID=A0A3M8T2G3_PSEPU|nr:hypothetical protein EFK07_17175 [Pseudomonas putida]